MTMMPIVREKKPKGYFHMVKPPVQIPRYMERCMWGGAHPYEDLMVGYSMVGVGRLRIDMTAYNSDVSLSHNTLTEEEEWQIQKFKETPKMEWAIHNSFDGLHMRKTADPAAYTTIIDFGVYLAEKDFTFWRLKYGV